ncbi:MAG TPA: sporulation protein YabP, partial [Clostridiaceae bacterium]|nr:sporulation protein YabP [Clostridiaceae bacterium]
METNIKKEHSLNLLNRQKLDLTGVVDVISFNEDSVILNTKLGTLNIKGKNMRVNKLNVDNG